MVTPTATDPAAHGGLTGSGPAAASAVTFTHSWNGSTDPTANEGAAIIADLDAIKANLDALNTAVDQNIADGVTAKAGVDANNTGVDAAIVDIAALKTALDAQNTVTDSILATLEAYGFHLSS